MTDPRDTPDTPEELAGVIGLLLQDYVKKHGHTLATRIECLGALEESRAELYDNPRKFGATN